jgi:hypothetical protein
MEFKIGSGLACLGIAVGIAQWLVPQDTLIYEIKFGIVLLAIFLFAAGALLLTHALYRFCKPPKPTNGQNERFQRLAAFLYASLPWYKRLFRRANPSPRRKQFEANESTELELDSFHNRRNIPLRIEFSNNDKFRHIGQTKGRGIVHQSQIQAYRVAIHNTTPNEIHGAQIFLNDIVPMPKELMGLGPIPLHITHEPPEANAITLAPQERRFVDVVSYLSRYWDPHILIHHTSPVAPKEIYADEDGYEIELLTKGNHIMPSRRRFKVCLIERHLNMTSLDQPDEEAFEEGFQSSQKNA